MKKKTPVFAIKNQTTQNLLLFTLCINSVLNNTKSGLNVANKALQRWTSMRIKIQNKTPGSILRWHGLLFISSAELSVPGLNKAKICLLRRASLALITPFLMGIN